MNEPLAMLPHMAWSGSDAAPFELQTPDLPMLDELLESRSLAGRNGKSLPLDVYIPALEGDLLYSLVRFLRPIVSLEVGLANGISALYIAQALHDNGSGSHLAIDPFQHADWQDAGLLALERAGLAPLVSVDQRLSHWVLPDLEQKGLRIQFAFVDGSHQFDYVMSDFLGIDRILDVGGLIAFDDSDWPAITQVIRFALNNCAYEVFNSGVVVEPSPIRPRWASRSLRAIARRWPALQHVVRQDFLVPAHMIGILGRCVVLKKLADDQRDSQSQQFVHF